MMITIALCIATAYLPLAFGVGLYKAVSDKTPAARLCYLLVEVTINGALAIAVARAWGWL